jgi:hypothetical protein
MLNAAEEKLVAELRSGQRKQIQGYLHVDGGYCCLGVACDISGLGEWRVSRRSTNEKGIPRSLTFYKYSTLDGRNESNIVLPLRVQTTLGWATEGGDLDIERPEGDSKSGQRDRMSLTELNDAGFTFSQIADVIEAGLVLKL